jgi:hypothetical protein
MRHLPVLLALVLASSTARADEAGVVVTGEATLQPQLAAQLEGWLREHGRRLVASPLDPDAINTLIDCFVLGDESCARNVVDRASKSPTLIYARVEVSPNAPDGSRDVTLVGYWLKKNSVHAIADRRLCERCTEKTLRGTADELMASLDHLATPAHGKDEDVAVHGSATPGQPSDRPSRTVPGALMTTGLVLAITGGAMIALGEQRPPKTGVQSPTYLDYGPPGYALGAVGVAALGVGVYMWLRAGSSSGPVAAVSSSSGYVGWSGRF